MVEGLMSISEFVDEFDAEWDRIMTPINRWIGDGIRETKEHSEELANLFEKVNDLVDMSTSLAKQMVRYVEENFKPLKEREEEEYQSLKSDVDFETFRLLKYGWMSYQQFTEKTSQLVGVIEAEKDPFKWPNIIHAAIEIAVNTENYTFPAKVDTSKLPPPLTMSDEEFEKVNRMFEYAVYPAQAIIENDEGWSDNEKCTHLARLLLSASHPREAKVVILIAAIKAMRVKKRQEARMKSLEQLLQEMKIFEKLVDEDAVDDMQERLGRMLANPEDAD